MNVRNLRVPRAVARATRRRASPATTLRGGSAGLPLQGLRAWAATPRPHGRAAQAATRRRAAS
jgi:hypothetical protein